MARKVFKARRSQLLSTFGVGSLFPAENNSFMITSIDQWDEKHLTAAPEPRLARSLGVGRLLLPPTGWSKVPVIRFPQVLSCPNCHRLGSMSQLQAGYEDVLCGLCKSNVPLTPSRFVVACEDGHVDDFPYTFWVHGLYPDSSAQHDLSLASEGRTSSLADMTVRCSCGKSRSMADAFSPAALREMKCTGRRLWLGKAYRDRTCGKPPRTVQRGASNVWFPAVRSAISIPPYSEFLAKVVGQRASVLSKPEALTQGDWVLEGIVEEFGNRFTIAELKNEVNRQFYGEKGEDLTDEVLRQQEFQALIAGRADQPDTDFVAEPMEVPETYLHWIRGVRKVTRLREVRALYGFSRLTPRTEDNPGVKLAAIFPEDNRQNWLPAIETLGEGLFIALDRSQLEEWASTDFATARRNTLQRNVDAAAKQRKVDAIQVDIVRVLLHTMAHVLIDQLSLDAGYPASSIRERLYAGEDNAGILLYTASSDSAGSLGGIAALAHPQRLAPALDEGLLRLSWCSADPVCIESTGAGADARNLAACHCCVLIPETSCELFNSFLDRGLLFGTPHLQNAGFLAWMESAGSAVRATAEKLPSQDDVAPAEVRQSLWQEIYEDSVDLRSLIERLVEAEVTPDQWGADIGPSNQWILDLSWPQQSIAVVATEDEPRDEWLADHGWIVLNLEELEPRDIAERVAAEVL
jgi:hypothetical protein